jgi:hypothetical protein
VGKSRLYNSLVDHSLRRLSRRSGLGVEALRRHSPEETRAMVFRQIRRDLVKQLMWAAIFFLALIVVGSFLVVVGDSR